MRPSLHETLVGPTAKPDSRKLVRRSRSAQSSRELGASPLLYRIEHPILTVSSPLFQRLSAWSWNGAGVEIGSIASRLPLSRQDQSGGTACDAYE